jgi:hypothetical protein
MPQTKSAFEVAGAANSQLANWAAGAITIELVTGGGAVATAITSSNAAATTSGAVAASGAAAAPSGPAAGAGYRLLR